VYVSSNQTTGINKELFKTYATPWFYIHGEEVSIIGSDDVEWGTFHGFGEQWWNNGNRVRTEGTYTQCFHHSSSG